jgi:hypothetical protein
MLKLSTSARAAAKSLAVAYQAYCEASERDDLNGICTWGRILLETQAKLDIQLVDQNRTVTRVQNARAILAKREAQAAADLEFRRTSAAFGACEPPPADEVQALLDYLDAQADAAAQAEDFNHA